MAPSADGPGEDILLTRWHTALAIGALLMGTLVFALLGLCVLSLIIVPESRDTGGLLVTSLFLLGSILLFGGACYLLTHKHWLVLCADRMQYRVGQCVRWEIPYREVTRIELFRNGLGARCLGICLSAPQRFDAAWPRLAWERAWFRRVLAVDLALPLGAASEPAERILEAALRCLHYAQAAAGTNLPKSREESPAPPGP